VRTIDPAIGITNASITNADVANASGASHFESLSFAFLHADDPRSPSCRDEPIAARRLDVHARVI
jgi:hypothetical protein